MNIYKITFSLTCLLSLYSINVSAIILPNPNPKGNYGDILNKISGENSGVVILILSISAVIFWPIVIFIYEKWFK